MTDAVSRLVAGSADADVAQRLRRLGIGYVVVRGADDEERARIGNTPGLGAASGTGAAVVWQLDPAVSRAAVVPADPASTDRPSRSPGPPPRCRPAPASGTCSSARPPTRAGTPSSTGRGCRGSSTAGSRASSSPRGAARSSGASRSVASWFLPFQGLALLVALVFAAPGIRRADVRDPVLSARRAATLSEVG